MSYLVVGLNPVFQKTLEFSSITPGAVNRTGIQRLDIAGKGINVSRVLTQLGKNAICLTQLGGVMRPLFLSLCEKDRINVEWAESNSPVRFCYTLINDADSSTTELVEESEPVGAGTEERLIEQFEKSLAGKEYLVIAGTNAAGFSENITPFMVRRAKEEGVKVILDIRGNDLVKSLSYKPDIIKPNLQEFASTFVPELAKDEALLGDSPLIKERIKPVMLNLCGEYNCRVILTRGSQKIWAAETGNFFEVECKPVKPVNTTGCGDAFTAGLASALGDGAGFAAAITEGIRCGALNAGCFRPGVIR